MKKELNKVAKDINQFLNLYLKKQIKTSLISPMRYGLFPGGKKIRSKILMDVGKICNVNYKTLIYLQQNRVKSPVLHPKTQRQT